jgi:hypothetical protein
MCAPGMSKSRYATSLTSPSFWSVTLLHIYIFVTLLVANTEI